MATDDSSAALCGGGADFTKGGTLSDGQSLRGWRPLSGSWSVAHGAMLGVGPTSRIVREGRYPPSYRLRLDVAPHGSPEVSWAVTVPVGDAFVLSKGLLHFSGKPTDWTNAWQRVEVTVRDGNVSFEFPGLVERPGERKGQGKTTFGDLARAQELWDKGFHFYQRQDGLIVLAPPAETWRPGTVSFQEELERGKTCLGGRSQGIALVAPCTGRDGRTVAETAGARFRNMVVEHLR